MIKVAVFVEGQTELVFVREYLLKMFDYQDVWIECYTLFTDNSFNTTEYAYPNSIAGYYFQIINVGNDNAVLARILKREQFLWNSGFCKIFGLRDMYSRAYRDEVQDGAISEEVNIKFLKGTRQTISERANRPDSIHFCFAIMEIEAWILGIDNLYNALDDSLLSTITAKLGCDIKSIDPEKEFFHPSAVLTEIFRLKGMGYNKNKGDINAILGGFNKSDFLSLYANGKCASFRKLHDELLPAHLA